MTKKIFNRVKGKTDILMAEPGVEGFISLKTGERYDEAQVSYKGSLFTPELLIERGQENGVSVSFESAQYTLLHIEQFKTRSLVVHKADDQGKVCFIG